MRFIKKPNGNFRIENLSVSATGVGGGSVTSAEYISLVGRVSGNSAQMTSADNAISNAVSIVSAAQAATSAAVVSVVDRLSALSTQHTSLAASVAGLLSAVAANSAQMTSADNAISAAAAAKNRIISVANQGSAFAVNPERIDFIGNAVSTYLSTSTIKVQISVTGGGASVTSAEYLSLVNRVSGNSAQMTSADDAISAAVAALSAQHTSLAASVAGLLSAVAANSAQMTSADNAILNAVSIVSAAVATKNNIITIIDDGATTLSSPTSFDFVGAGVSISVSGAKAVVIIPGGAADASVTSAEFLSLVDRVSGNSAQMTSADNAISNAVSIVSAAQAVTSAAVTSVVDRLSVLSTQHTSLAASVAGLLSAVAANSAQMTSADNAISAAVVALSAQHTSLAASVAGALSAIAANSAQMTSADNTISAAVVALSAQHTSLAASVAGLLSAVAANSAQMTSADNAISNAVSIVSVAVTTKNNIITVIDDGATVLSNPTSFDFTGAGVSVSVSGAKAILIIPGGAGGGSVTSANFVSLRSAVQANSAQMTSADNAISAAVNALSAQVVSADNAVSANAASANNVLSQQLSVLSVKVGGILNTQIRIVSSMQSTNGSALVAISGMVLTVAAGETWRVEGYLLVSTSATTVGLRAGWSVPPLSLPRYTKFIAGSAAQSATIAGGGGQLQVSGSSILLSIAGIGAAGVAVPVKFDTVFNVASAGVVNLMACGIASTAASPLHIMGGTYMIAYRIK